MSFTPRRGPVLALALPLALLLAVPAAGSVPTGDLSELAPLSGPPEIVTAEAPHELVEQMEAAGVDVHHAHRPLGNGLRQIDAIMTPGAQDFWAQRGLQVVDVEDVPTNEELAVDFSGRAGTPAAVAGSRSQGKGRGAPSGGIEAPQLQDGPLRVLRADTFTGYAGTFISVEVWSDEGRGDDLTVQVGDLTEELDDFTDARQYMYHRFRSPEPADVAPGDEIVVTDDDGNTVTATLEEWVPGEAGGTGYPEGYRWAFTDGYVDAFQSRAKIRQLAAEFPELAEIVDLPEDSPGYRRPARAGLGDPDEGSYIWAETEIDGHEGGDDHVLEIVDPGVANAALAVDYDGTTVTVTLATDGEGTTTSLVADVVEAINTSDAGADLTAHPFVIDGSPGLAPTGVAQFDDDLDGPANPEDPLYAELHEPFDIEAIRIGKHRDGSKPGVLAYSQEHAREWVTPLVALETAERLLRNYGTDPETTRLVDELDIFIIPSVNPDGTNVSMWDDLMQRKNFNNYCEGILSPNLADSYAGVDLNRNFTVGSRLDGYAGASSSCTSGSFSPAELSEPEARNEVWLTEQFDNIAFSMNTHSYGGYFMWAPGAYIRDGRVPLPRPSLGTEEYFFDASEDILSAIKEHRGTVIHPGRTGPVIDVLYSAAGNSADEHYYTDDADKTGDADPQIFAWNFEVGADRWDGRRWSSPGYFWPDYETEGFDQAMEFANGWLGFLEIAADYAADVTGPTATPNVGNGGWYSGPVDVVFETSEAADVYYTTDGSVPTQDSQVVERRRLRDGAEPIHITESTTLRWIAVDAAGNEGRPQRAEIRIR